jgi:hypothetical protein
MIEATGGKTGVRDIDLLESVIFNAFTTFDGVELYPGIEDKCVNICYSIVKNIDRDVNAALNIRLEGCRMLGII